MEVYVDTLRLLAQPKGQQQFKNKKQPELTENQTVWKSDTQGDKEETVTRLVGGAERTQGKAAGRPSEAADCGAGWAKLEQQLVDQVTDCATQSSSAGK